MPETTEGGFKIFRREDFGNSFSGHCWVVDVRLPDGRVVTVHDPAEPKDYYACGHPHLCDEVRALYEGKVDA